MIKGKGGAGRVLPQSNPTVASVDFLSHYLDMGFRGGGVCRQAEQGKRSPLHTGEELNVQRNSCPDDG